MTTWKTAALGAALAAAAGTAATHLLLTWLSYRKLGFAGGPWPRGAVRRSRHKPD